MVQIQTLCTAQPGLHLNLSASQAYQSLVRNSRKWAAAEPHQFAEYLELFCSPLAI
jgi:hypothetical protein